MASRKEFDGKVNERRIVRIEWAVLSGRRPRKAGCNARLGEHGQEVRLPIARLTTGDGATGFGWSRISPQGAAALAGFTLDRAFDLQDGVGESWRALEYPIWDLAGQLDAKINEGKVDFGDLDERLQQQVLRTVCTDQKNRRCVLGCNVWIQRSLSARHDEVCELIADNARAIGREFSRQPSVLAGWPRSRAV